MLDFFSAGMVSVWLSMAQTPDSMATAVSTWEETPWFAEPSNTDITTQAIVQQYLAGLKNKGLSTTGQGIWIQAGPAVLTTNVGTTPLPSASLTKVATTLVALETWGPDHRFETLISATGPIQAGTVYGDLVVQAGGDPFFVWEEGFALGNTLNQMGIRAVTGNLIIVGSWQMNFEVDPKKSGELLKRSLNAALWDEDASYQHAQLPAGTKKPSVAIAGSVQLLTDAAQLPAPPTLLVRHYSVPMVQILKQMNVHSNNPISESLAVLVGGGAVVAQKAAMLAGVPQTEILLANGSGLGMENRISPRAVTAMYAALQRYLEPRNLTIADLFPVSGRDGGTIDYRRIPTAAVVKTGTLNEVSALAGALPTRDRGVVWFTIINRGTDLEDLRDQQDALLHQLTKQWGAVTPTPLAIAPRLPDQTATLLGAPSRNVIVYRPTLEVRNPQ